MELHDNSQISGHLHNSTTVWTQPKTPEQRAYYSKHAAEKRVFAWITTMLQTAHGAIAFAAWTAIYLWVFKNIPFMLPTAPFLAGGTLIALHILFRTTWQTYWYDRLDDDPNTDSPVWVPAAIIVLLLFAEVQGARQYLSAQVTPIARRSTDMAEQEYKNTVASFEQAYKNEVAEIAALYKAKTAPLDRQIAGLRARSAVTDQERRNIRSRIAQAQASRDQVLTEKAAAIERALATATAARNNEMQRRDKALSEVDNHNAGELARYTADLGSVGTYAWVLSVGLLLLIAGLSYRTVRINVKSGIIPLRNYTVLDAHGSIAERLFTAFGDAINRRALQFAVWIHRLLSPNQAITSFDGTVVAKPGTYNTPDGFWPDGTAQSAPRSTSPLSTGEGSGVRSKTEAEAAAEVLAKLAANPGIRLTDDQVREEIALSLRTNGQYPTLPLPGSGKKPDAPAATAGPTHQPAGATRTAPNPSTSPLSTGDASGVSLWVGMVKNQIAEYDRAIQAGKPDLAAAIQHHLMTDPTSPLRLEGQRLGLRWGVRDGEFVVGRRDRDHYVPLDQVTEATLNAPISAPSAPAQGADDDDLFKQNIELFKQNILPHTDADGRVIGVKYRKKGGDWTTYDYPTVRGQYRIYLQRAQKGETSQAVSDGLEKWQYALTLFEEGGVEIQENIRAITA